MPLTFKLDTSIVSLKCSTSVSAVMSRSKLTKVAAVESLVYAAASLVPGTIGFPAVSFTSPEVNRKNVVFAALARSLAAVKSFTFASIRLKDTCNPSEETEADPPVSGTEDPVLALCEA